VGFPLGGSVGSGFVRFRAGRPELPVAVLAKVWPHSGEFGYLGPHSGECGYMGPRSGECGYMGPRSGECGYMGPHSGECGYLGFL
jgi:hypothetical protein